MVFRDCCFLMLPPLSVHATEYIRQQAPHPGSATATATPLDEGVSMFGAKLIDTGAISVDAINYHGRDMFNALFVEDSYHREIGTKMETFV